MFDLNFGVKIQFMKFIWKLQKNYYIIYTTFKSIMHKTTCKWGCSSTCTIESNYVCSGGTTSIFISGTPKFLPVTENFLVY